MSKVRSKARCAVASLINTGQFEGTVRDASGNGVSRLIEFKRASGAGWSGASQSDGSYCTTPLEQDLYDAYCCGQVVAKNVPLGSAFVQFDFTCATGQFKGTSKDSSGSPIGNKPVAFKSGGVVKWSGYTKAGDPNKGTYTSDPLHYGIYGTYCCGNFKGDVELKVATKTCNFTC